MKELKNHDGHFEVLFKELKSLYDYKINTFSSLEKTRGFTLSQMLSRIRSSKL